MRGELSHRVGRLAYPLFERFSPAPWDNLPRPSEARGIVRGAGHDSFRVLLAGGSSAVGWGVVSHDLALAGHLARRTAAIVGRGVDVEVYSYPRLTTPGVAAALSADAVSRYDALVLTLGGRESFEFMPVRLWRSQLLALLEHLDELDDCPETVIVGAEERSPVRVGRWIESRAMARAAAFNAATRELIAKRPRVHYVDSAMVPWDPTSRGVVDLDKGRLYDRAARAIAPQLAAVLDRAPVRLRHVVDEEARLDALERVQSLGAEAYARLAPFLETVKAVLHARSADLFFVGRDEVRLLAATTETVRASPRALSMSSAVLESPNGIVVPDLAADPLHRDRPEVVGAPHLRFYAGYPVESPEGYRVGVLAVVDTRPRRLDPSELALLRTFAHRAGTLLFTG